MVIIRSKSDLPYLILRKLSGALRLMQARMRAGVNRYALTPFKYRRIGKGCRFYGSIEMPYWGQDIRIGNECELGSDMFLGTGPLGRIEIGNGVSINREGLLLALRRITIGDNTRIGERVTIRDQDHKTNDTYIRNSGFHVAPIIIGANCWIGANVVITKGVVVGDYCVIGAGAIVTKNVPSFSVAVGIPAKPIKIRDFKVTRSSAEIKYQS